MQHMHMVLLAKRAIPLCLPFSIPPPVLHIAAQWGEAGRAHATTLLGGRGW